MEDRDVALQLDSTHEQIAVELALALHRSLASRKIIPHVLLDTYAENGLARRFWHDRRQSLGQILGAIVTNPSSQPKTRNKIHHKKIRNALLVP